MKVLCMLSAIIAVATVVSAVTAAPPSNRIGWTRRGVDGGEQVFLYSGGQSQISIGRFGEPKTAKPGWTVSTNEKGTIYRNDAPFSPEDTKKLYQEIVAAGIEDVRPFEMREGGTLAAIITIRGVTEIKIPDFYGVGKEDHNVASENHKRFLAVKRIMDKILDENEKAAFEDSD